MTDHALSFYSRSARQASGLGLPPAFVLFHGTAVDDRGELAVALEGMTATKVPVRYGIDEMTLSVGDQTLEADRCATLFAELDPSVPVVLEATTLGFAELFSSVRALLACGAKRLEIIYVEPQDYNRPNAATDQFELSDLITGYRPIPHSIVDLSSDELEAGVFFLGFEPERLERALEEHQMISTKEVKVVFGLPAFQPGWELNSVVPHLPRLIEQAQFDIAFCSANDPEAAFECLDATRSSLGLGKKMFVAPIGTKPCGIAAALFASIYPDQVGLLFDHPQRKRKRSEGASVWHRFSVTLRENARSPHE